MSWARLMSAWRRRKWRSRSFAKWQCWTRRRCSLLASLATRERRPALRLPAQCGRSTWRSLSLGVWRAARGPATTRTAIMGRSGLTMSGLATQRRGRGTPLLRSARSAKWSSLSATRSRRRRRSARGVPRSLSCKLMGGNSTRRLTLLRSNWKRKSRFPAFSLKGSKSIPSPLPVGAALKASSLVGASHGFLGRLAGEIGKLPASVHGIPPTFSTLLPVRDSKVTSTVLRRISRSLWLATALSRTAARLSTTRPTRVSTQWAVGLATVPSAATSSSSLAHAQVLNAVLSALDTLFLRLWTFLSSPLIGSAWQVRWATVSSKPPRRRSTFTLRRTSPNEFLILFALSRFIKKFYQFYIFKI